MNLPNILTVIRFALIPVFCITFFGGGPHRYIYAALVFSLASATDVLDGYIARRYNLITNFGKIADPLADKSMQICALFCMQIADIIPNWVVLAVIVKELVMLVGGIILYTSKVIVSADKYGKLATVVFYISIVLLIVFKNMPVAIKYSLILLSMFFMLLALFNYANQFKKIKSKLKYEREDVNA